MRYIFTEEKGTQSVYDIDKAILYRAYTFDNSLKTTIEGACQSGFWGLTKDRAISFWLQLAKQVDERCGIKDARERMLAFTGEDIK